jgi:hypothetical protein
MVILLVSVQDKAYGQFAESCRAPSPQVFPGAAPRESGRLVELVPSLCVSERYDSNVFMRSSTLRVQREDYVTSVNPMLRVNHNGDYARGFLDMGGFSETFVNNSGLNFLGGTGTLSLSLDNTVKRVLPNAGLFITDAVNYTPSPPGFVNPVAGTNPGAPVNIQDVFAQGILIQRTNRVTNSGTVSATYTTSASTRVVASYSHAILRFLSDSAILFNTTTQTATIGGTAQVSGVDQLNVKYSFANSEFSGSSVSSVLFRTHTATAGWSRVLTPNFTVEVGGGGIVIDPGRTTYAANAAGILNIGTTRGTLSYARSAFPGFTGVPTQVVGDVVSLSVIQYMSPQWQLTGSANYSRSSGTNGTSAIKFDSYGGSVNLAYMITTMWTTALGYDYLRFDREFGAVRDQFDRHVVMFTLRVSLE